MKSLNNNKINNLTIEDFIEKSEIVKSVINRVDELKRKPLKVSDVIDDSGNQYVDLIQEGG